MGVEVSVVFPTRPVAGTMNVATDGQGDDNGGLPIVLSGIRSGELLPNLDQGGFWKVGGLYFFFTHLFAVAQL